MRNLFLGLAMLLTAGGWGGQAYADHAVMVGDTSYTGIACKGEDGKRILELAAVEYEITSDSLQVQIGLNTGICGYVKTTVRAVEVYDIYKDWEGDWFSIVRIEDGNKTSYYTLFWAKFTKHISKLVFYSS